MNKDTANSVCSLSTLQRYETTEKFIKALGITSKHRTSKYRRSCSKKPAVDNFISTTDSSNNPISFHTDIHSASTTADPIPVPSFTSPLAYIPQKSKESPSSSHSPRDIYLAKRSNRKPSFTNAYGNITFGGTGSFVVDKVSSFEVFSKRKKAESFRHFLFPRLSSSWNRSLEDLSNMSSHAHYDPELLDDEECRQNRHLLSLLSFPQYPPTFSHVSMPFHGPHMALPLQAYKSNELKRELNDLFSSKHPEYNNFLKLSHIRSIKIKLLDVALDLHIDLSTIALSYTYFEKLFIKKAIVKSNRSKIAGACLLLAVKVNDNKDIRLSILLSALERRLQVQQEDILKCEFWVFCSLGFGLVLMESEYRPHLYRLFDLLNVAESIQEYLGPKMYNAWKDGVVH